MIELFPNVSEFTRMLTKFWIEQAKKQKNPERAAQMLIDFRDVLGTEEEKAYLDFSIDLYYKDLTKQDE